MPTVEQSKAQPCSFCGKRTTEAYQYPSSGRIQPAHDQCRKAAARERRTARKPAQLKQGLAAKPRKAAARLTPARG